MDILLWLGWACAVFTLLFATMIGLFGAIAMKSPRWDREFHRLGEEEWARRGLSRRKLTVAEEHCQPRFLGQDSEPDADFRVRTLDAVQVLVGGDDRSELASFLDKRSDTYLAAALEKVSASVRDIPNLEAASRIWVFRRQLALIESYGRSLVWFAPRCFKLLAKSIERYMLTATILGIVLGLLYWGFGTTPEGGAYWANFLGILVTVGTVLALLLAAGKRVFAVIVALFGPAKTWTFKGIAVGSVMGIFTFGLITLSRAGVWEEWQRVAAEHTSALLAETPAGNWAVSALFAAMVYFGARNALRRARSPWLQTGDRLAAAAAVPLVIALGTCLIAYALGAPLWLVQNAGLVFFYSFLGCAAILAVTENVRWIVKYRTLREAGVHVKRGWFRGWMLWAWFASLLIVCIGPAIPSAASHLPWLKPVYTLWMFSNIIVMLALTLSFPVGAVVTWRFVRRVSKCHSEFEASQVTALPARDYRFNKK